MARRRLSIAMLMGLVLWVAVALAALKEPSPLWASAVYTAAVVGLLASILGTVARRGRARLAWAGAAVFGGCSLALGFGPWPWLNNDGLRPPALLPAALLDHFKAKDAALAKNWTSIAKTIQAGQAGNTFGPADLSIGTQGIVTVKTGARSTQAYLTVRLDISPYKQVAHSLGALLFAALGAWLGWAIAPREDRAASTGDAIGPDPSISDRPGTPA